MPSKICAIVLTYNEEHHIVDCLESLTWCDEIWVVDSYSADRTVDVCRRFTGNIVSHEFENFSKQRQWALENLPILSDWILFVDADERITPELAREIPVKTQNSDFDGYYIPRKQYFWGTWLRFGECSPSYSLRLHRRGKGRYPLKEVHESLVVDGRIGFLKERMVHISRETMTELIDKLNKYSTRDAIRMYRTGQDLYTTEDQSYSSVNMALKYVFRLLPFKPLCKFFHDYVIRQGFRDGRLGFTWALAQGLYVFLCYFKLWEMRQGIVQSGQAEPDESPKLEVAA